MMMMMMMMIIIIIIITPVSDNHDLETFGAVDLFLLKSRSESMLCSRTVALETLSLEEDMT